MTLGISTHLNINLIEQGRERESRRERKRVYERV